MPANQYTVDDVTTTNTVDVWRNKLYREERCVFRECLCPFLTLSHHTTALLACRSKAEWHYRWGPTFGLPSVPPDAKAYWRPTMGPIPTLPVPGRGPNTVEPTASALRWDAAVNRGILPTKVPSSESSGSSESGGERPQRCSIYTATRLGWAVSGL